jgi:hypothetical protein
MNAELEAAVERVTEMIDAEVAGVECPPSEYVEALKDIASHIEICLEAAADDLRRAESDE